ADEAPLRDALRRALDLGKGIVMVAAPLDELRTAADDGDADGYARASAAIATKLFSTRRACSSCGTSFPEPDPRMFSFNSKIGWCPGCLGTGVKLPYVPTLDPKGRSDEDSTAEAVGALAEKLADQLGAQAESDEIGRASRREGAWTAR